MKQSWKIPAICGILMVVFNVIVFALPIYKTPVVLISDIAVVIAIAAQIPISSIASAAINACGIESLLLAESSKLLSNH